MLDLRALHGIYVSDDNPGGCSTPGQPSVLSCPFFESVFVGPAESAAPINSVVIYRQRPHQHAPTCRRLMDPKQLPVRRHAAEIAQSVRDNPVTVVIGETGSGKTTQISQILEEAGLAAGGVIAVTQPRRVVRRPLFVSPKKLHTRQLCRAQPGTEPVPLHCNIDNIPSSSPAVALPLPHHSLQPLPAASTAAGRCHCGPPCGL